MAFGRNDGLATHRKSTIYTSEVLSPSTELKILYRNQWKIAVIRKPHFFIAKHIHGVAIIDERHEILFCKFEVFEDGLTLAIKTDRAILSYSGSKYGLIDVAYPNVTMRCRLDVVECPAIQTYG